MFVSMGAVSEWECEKISCDWNIIEYLLKNHCFKIQFDKDHF